MINKRQFISLISNAEFQELFVTELGWNRFRGQSQLPTITIDEVDFDFTAIAERNGFQILTAKVRYIPTNSLCRKIDTKLRRQANDYIAIYQLDDSEHHLWCVPVKTNEKRDLVLIEYDTAQKSDLLYSKVDGFSFELGEDTNIVDLRSKVHTAFAVNSEKITKDFYAGFKKEHKAFADLITGIDDNIVTKDNRNKQWYTSVMLNRLMFCYFIQKKGFLNLDFDYLRHKLEWVRQEQGADRFYKSFYRGFLTHLFHDGLNTPKHDPEFERVYGKIPYLNGGMFDRHQLEVDYPDIEINDDAFIRLFNFFDTWEWHLDTRITASGKDINPDVLGYIFEQYINDRAQMGAYYTKEDITEYIGKNCIIPFLMDKTAEKSNNAFAPDGFVWQTLRESGDRYIYDAVKKGYSKDWASLIPENIAKGIDTTLPKLLERRADWNTKTPEDFALPTEIWRETIERLQRCESLLSKIRNGEITHINDFITYNLDIRSFVYDLLHNATDHLYVLHFYKALQSVTILDPTCGSGAFLFAAMNILEPLYEVCIERMQEFNAQNPLLFKTELDEISNKYRSNIQYFIFKSIILRNLYGVDIMVEATEIAKLRLFLKMVAVVEVDRRADNLGLDPLPDIDFNIRCGNALVGYATEEELNNDLTWGDMFANAEFRDKVESEMKLVSMTYDTFKHVQINQEENLAEFKQAKADLKSRLASLNELLNRRMHANNPLAYEDWLASHQPFHWLAEFYQIIKGNGGFDVIIGNPPYVGYTRKNKLTKKAVIDIYQLSGYITLPTSNLYAFVIERSHKLMHNKAKIGMIIPISAFANNSMEELQNMLKKDFGNLYISTFHQRPAQLFEGVLQRLSIFISNKNKAEQSVLTTGIYRWYANTRESLFQLISYVETNQSKQSHFVKLGTKIEVDIFKKYSKHKSINNYIGVASKSNNLYYRTAGGGYWVTFLNEEFDCVSVSNKHTSIQDDINAKVLSAALNSNLFWWYYSINFDLFNFKDYMIFGFQLNYSKNSVINHIIELSNNMEKFLRDNAIYYTINSSTNGANETVTYQKSKSKYIMDIIDISLSEIYNFTEEELDFIINYDIKYRMGDELNE